MGRQTMSDNGNLTSTPIAEMIGRSMPQAAVQARNLWLQVTADWTQADYGWWDKLARGKQPGYELGALFAQPIADILADWTLGKGVDVGTGDEYTDKALSDFIAENLIELIDYDTDASTKGDSYLGVNPDATLTAIPPNTVDIEPDPLDYRKVWSYKVTTRPNEKITIVDEYRLLPTAGRTLTIKQGGVDTVYNFSLLADRLPIIHYPQRRGPNEVYGHPVYEALRKLFAEYDDVISKGISGVKVMGNPVPVVEGCEDPEGEMTRNRTDTETITLANGETAEVPVVDFAQLKMLFLGKGATFKFASPTPFTEDTGRMLEFLFLLMLQHSRIPEWAWGGAIASSKASVEAQMPAFSRFIEGRQRRFEKYLKELVTVWMQIKSLTDRQIRADLPLTVTWPSVVPSDKELMLKWVEYLHGKAHILTDETAVTLADVVDDPAAEVEAAQKEAEEKADREEEAMQREIDRMAKLNQDDNGDEITDDQEANEGRNERAAV
jgi:hypothetical protein